MTLWAAALMAAASPALAAEDVPRPARTISYPVMAVGGDVNLGRRQNWVTSNEGAGAALGALTILRSAELSLINLESVAASGGHPAEKGEQAPHYFRGRPEMLSVLEWAGIDLAALANNHSLDYGFEALEEEIGYLNAMGLGHAGAGADFEAACAPAFRSAGSLTVAVFSVDATIRQFAAGSDQAGICHLDPGDPARWSAHFSERIKRAHQSAHLVFVAVHWGANYVERPTANTRELARRIIAAGADGILGSSAHVVHGLEIIDGRPVIYDAGDLLMDSIDVLNSGRSESSVVFVLSLRPDGVARVEVWPTRVGFGRTELDFGRGAHATLARFAALSAELGTEVTIESDHASIALPSPPKQRGPFDPMEANPGAGASPLPLSAPPAECVVADVPVAARIRPVDFGPLSLVGLRVEPSDIRERRTVWVETFWTTKQASSLDLLIDARLEPRQSGRVWRGAFHQPCDWQWPTTRWRPGNIYRDGYSIRPPRTVDPGAYDLTLAVLAGLNSREIISDRVALASVTVVRPP